MATQIGSLDPQRLDLSESLTAQLVPPPVEGQPGACWRCRTWNDLTDEDRCWNCTQVAAEFDLPAVPLDLISLYRKPSQLRQWLTCYKGRLDESESESFIPEYVGIVKALLSRYFYEHGVRITVRAPADCVVVVPSTSRPPPHPLHSIVVEIGMQVPGRALLRRGPGVLGFNQPARDGFASAEKCSPQRVILVDDVYTAGARINSEVVALADAGHDVCGAFVMAPRKSRPSAGRRDLLGRPDRPDLQLVTKPGRQPANHLSNARMADDTPTCRQVHLSRRIHARRARSTSMVTNAHPSPRIGALLSQPPGTAGRSAQSPRNARATISQIRRV